MGYINSLLAGYVKLSPNHSGKRVRKINKITPHCVERQCTAEPYKVKEKVYAKLIELRTDICRRNGKKKLCGLQIKISCGILH